MDPATDNNDADLQRYADEYLVYYTEGNSPKDAADWGRVYSETLQGRGTYSFAYATNSTNNGGNGFDTWFTKAVETLPDSSASTVYLNASGAPVLKSFFDNTSRFTYPTFYKYDSSGRLLWMAHSSAFVQISGAYYSESNPDLVFDGGGASSYLSQNSGLIEGTDYYASTTATPTTPGGVAGYVQDTFVQQGEAGTKVLQESNDYVSQTASAGNGGQTIYVVADDTVYGKAGGDARVTRYQYQFVSGTTQLQQETTIAPPITSGPTGQNGPALNSTDTANADTVTEVFDADGRVIWKKDGDGFLSYNQYDPATGDLVKHIDDVNTNDTGDFSNLPSGWTTPAAGGQELITSYSITFAGVGAIQPQGAKVTLITEPDQSVTYQIELFSDNGFVDEVRAYPGWHFDNVSQKYTTTGPVTITRRYLPAANAPTGQQSVYDETLTLAAPLEAQSSPSASATDEPINSSTIQSLSRGLHNAAGDVAETDDYFSLSGVTYSAATAQLGSSSNNSASGNFHATVNGFDTEGRLTSVTDPTGTITQYLLNGLGLIREKRVGTSSGMVDVADYFYDASGTGDGDLTEIDQHVDSTTNAPDQVTLNLYDFRDRLIATKQGAMIDAQSGLPAPSEETDGAHRLITLYVLDNLGESTGTYTIAGDGTDLSALGASGAIDAEGYPTVDMAKIRAMTLSSFDDQGRVYLTRQANVDPNNGLNGLDDTQIDALAKLATNTYYNHRGLTIETSNPGGLVYKHSYDGAGRDVKDSTTDGGVVNGAAQNWANAGTTVNDVVIEQTLNTYDKNGNLTETELRERFHTDATDTTGLGDLQGPGGGNLASRDYFNANYYDLANRLTDSVNVGTNGGTAWTRPSTVPTGSNVVLVNHSDYNAAGLVGDTIDPRGIRSETLYDLLGRQTEAINAWDGTQNPTPTSSTNQITQFTYDGGNHILTQTAVMPSGTPNQTTTNVYGVAMSGTLPSKLFSNDLLAKIEYPIKSGANAGQSDTTNAADWQRFAYDAQGEKTTFEDQNGTIHGYTLDVLGRLAADIITTVGTGVDGAIRYLGYNFNDAGLPFQQTSYTDTLGPVGANNVANQVEDQYNGFEQLITQYQSHSGPVSHVGAGSPAVQYGYNNPGTGNFSRLISIGYPSGRYEDYEYEDALGNAISRISTISDSGGGRARIYQFLGLSTAVVFDGNNVTLSYVQQPGDTLTNTDGGDQYTGLDRFGRVIDQNWLAPSAVGGSVDRFQYGYDADSNVLFKNNLVNANFSELYHVDGSGNGYDQLNRLKHFERGTLNSTNDTIATPNPLAGSSNDWTMDAVGNITQGSGVNRSVNSQNQLTQVGSTALTYDNNGNTLTDQAGNTYAFDAWNHIVSLNGTYTYKWDALGRKIVEGTTGLDLYYNASGNVVEERSSGTGSTTAQYVWGMGYVNDLVAKDNFTTGVRVYAEQDANWNVTSLTDVNGNPVERFMYDPYGTRTVLSPSWAVTSDSYGMPYGFQGGRADPVSGLIQFGVRTYNPATDTWAQADPAGYIDGSDEYQFERDNTPVGSDLSGLSDKAQTGAGTGNAIKWGTDYITQFAQKELKTATTGFRASAEVDLPLFTIGPVVVALDGQINMKVGSYVVGCAKDFAGEATIGLGLFAEVGIGTDYTIKSSWQVTPEKIEFGAKPDPLDGQWHGKIFIGVKADAGVYIFSLGVKVGVEIDLANPYNPAFIEKLDVDLGSIPDGGFKASVKAGGSASAQMNFPLNAP